MTFPQFLKRILGCCLLLAAIPHLTFAESASKGLSDEEKRILKMGINELLQTEIVVTSVSKKPQKISETASAVFVVTQDDIRRTGAVNIMEALRIVPGVQVSKINQNRYAISIRGFNRRLGSDKLLVLMDGRTLYSPSAAGVFWLGQDTMMEDIDRIEVIRGPGAALWGSNAVAGVINIITKSAHETKGGLVAGGGGNEERGFASLRYGAEIAPGLDVRGYGKFRSRDTGELASGAEGIDGKELAQGGMRLDWEIDDRTKLNVQGDYYNVDAGLDFIKRFISLQAGTAPFQGLTTQKGGNFLARFSQEVSDTSDYSVQAYYDRLERESAVPFDNTVDQFDFEFQHNFQPLESHQVSWGANYRAANFNFDTTNIVSLPKEKTDLYGFFLHDEITLIPDKWHLILGSKFEHNQFTGWEIQPNIRTLYNLNEQHSLWAAVSRAVRIPTIRESEAVVNRTVFSVPGVAQPFLFKEVNTGNLDSEKLMAYELGYRFNNNSAFRFDVTAFYFNYDDLIEFTTLPRTFETTPAPPHFQITADNRNAIDGWVTGAELAAEWQVHSNVRLAGSYSILEADLEPTNPLVFIPDGSGSDGDFDVEGEPRHVFSVRSYIDLPHNLDLSAMFYYVSRNRARQINAYERLDLRLGWQLRDNLNIAITGQNLTNSTHLEMNELLERSTQTQRSYYFKTIFTF